VALKGGPGRWEQDSDQCVRLCERLYLHDDIMFCFQRLASLARLLLRWEKLENRRYNVLTLPNRVESLGSPSSGNGDGTSGVARSRCWRCSSSMRKRSASNCSITVRAGANSGLKKFCSGGGTASWLAE